MKLAIISDAWYPQTNGVVRTLDTVKGLLEKDGVDVVVISPADFRTIPCPTYPEIRLAMGAAKGVARRMDAYGADAIHIATEGPLGLAARRYCLRRGLAFTTAYHTKFPEYVNVRSGLPLAWGYGFMRWFHKPSSGVMVAAATLEEELCAHGFKHLKRWSRGVDLDLFKPGAKDQVAALNALPRPLLLYVGRVAVEKNIGAFLDLKTTGTKVVVGDGPQRAQLERDYPEVVFTGAQHGESLADHYRAADVFVFPSRTDTFGLVMLEALACGVPVAGYPVPGPLDVVGAQGHGTVAEFIQPVGALDHDLSQAVERAQRARPDDCRRYALHYGWPACAARFVDNLVWASNGLPVERGEPAPLAALG